MKNRTNKLFLRSNNTFSRKRFFENWTLLSVETIPLNQKGIYLANFSIVSRFYPLYAFYGSAL